MMRGRGQHLFYALHAAALACACSASASFAAGAEAAGGAATAAAPTQWVSASGDPGLAAEIPSVLIVGWNFCNEALAPAEYPTHPSPRWADCGGRVTAADNALGPGDAFRLPGFNASTDPNAYAIQKELFLGALCAQPAAAGNWSFHTIMLKSGNMNVGANICPETVAAAAAAPGGGGLTFNNLDMNQPLLALSPSAQRAVPYGGRGYVGSLGATYDVDPKWSPAQAAAVQAALTAYTEAWIAYRFAEIDGTPLPPLPSSQTPALLVNRSYEGVVWYRNVSSGSFVFHHIQQSSAKAPWLMSYFKLMDTVGIGGGYDWAGSGQMFGPVPSYASRLRVRYQQLTTSNLYLPCHGGCWKLDGSPCDGDLDSDITRYICYLVNSGSGGCEASNQGACPLFHIRSNDTAKIFRNDTKAFPYHCYSAHCGPGGGGVGGCDPYSNPGPQELMMLTACEEWGVHGYPTVPSTGQGELLDLDVGGLGARVALVGAEPADVGPAVRAARGWAPLPPLDTLPPYPGWTRSWVGFDFGTEQFAPAANRYEFSEIDVLVAAA